MKDKTIEVEAREAGKITLTGTFTTGFRRDLHLAREIVRRRRNRSVRAFTGAPS